MATDWKHYFSIKLSGLFGMVGTRGKDRLYYAGGLQRKIFKFEEQLEINQKKYDTYINEELAEIEEMRKLIHNEDTSDEFKREFIKKVEEFKETKIDLDSQMETATKLINEELAILREKLSKVKLSQSVINDLKNNKELYDMMI